MFFLAVKVCTCYFSWMFGVSRCSLMYVQSLTPRGSLYNHLQKVESFSELPSKRDVLKFGGNRSSIGNLCVNLEHTLQKHATECAFQWMKTSCIQRKTFEGNINAVWFLNEGGGAKPIGKILTRYNYLFWGEKTQIETEYFECTFKQIPCVLTSPHYNQDDISLFSWSTGNKPELFVCRCVWICFFSTLRSIITASG